MKPMKPLFFAVLSALAFFAQSSDAATTLELQRIQKDFLSVPAPELPGKAAELVAKAKPDDRKAVALTLVRIAVFQKPTVAPHIISAISKAEPALRRAMSQIANALWNSPQLLLDHKLDWVATFGSARTRTQALEPAPIGEVNTFSTPINQQTGGNGAGTFEGAVVLVAPPGDDCMCYDQPRDI